MLEEFDSVYRKDMIAVVDDYGWPFSEDATFFLRSSQNDPDSFEFPASRFRRATKVERFLYKMSGWSAQIEAKEENPLEETNKI